MLMLLPRLLETSTVPSVFISCIVAAVADSARASGTHVRLRANASRRDKIRW